MYKYLLFDDQRLFKRENLIRKYGEPVLLADDVYTDGISSTCLPSPWVFKLDNGKYRMLYMGKTEIHNNHLFSAISDNGINFEPEDLTAELGNKEFSHEIMSITGEVGYICEDKINPPEERYKMIYTELEWSELICRDRLFVSPDLIHWKEIKDVDLGVSTEPVMGIFYNEYKKCFTIMLRPNWGVRMVGYIETTDWRNFTPYSLCLHSDCLDAPLAEIYGMSAFAYDGYYIGLPHLYSGFDSALSAKFFGGTMKSEIAYSWDGNHWLRSLREPFLSGIYPENGSHKDFNNPMVWPSSMQRDSDGNIYIYAAATTLEHGPAFNTEGLIGKIYVYKLRPDGFIRLMTESSEKCGVVATRENVWNSGELHINLKAESATVAVYQSDKIEEKDIDMNVLGICEPLKGYGHDDCVPFSGDSTDWVPQFKNGKTLSEQNGKVLTFEIKISNGEIYSISSDSVPVFNTEGERYRKLKKFPGYIRF